MKLRVVLLLPTLRKVSLLLAAAAAAAAALRRPRPLELNEANQVPILWPPTVDHDISSMATDVTTLVTSANCGMSRSRDTGKKLGRARARALFSSIEQFFDSNESNKFEKTL